MLPLVLERPSITVLFPKPVVRFRLFLQGFLGGAGVGCVQAKVQGGLQIGVGLGALAGCGVGQAQMKLKACDLRTLGDRGLQQWNGRTVKALLVVNPT